MSACFSVETEAAWAASEANVNTKSTKDMERAQAAFHKKEDQAREGKAAMAEYLAAGKAERAKTEKLRELRLAKEAEEARNAQIAAAVEAAKPKKAAKVKPEKPKAAKKVAAKKKK